MRAKIFFKGAILRLCEASAFAVVSACFFGMSSASAAGTSTIQAVASLPTNKSVNVAVTTTPYISFSEPLDVATVVSNNIQLRLFVDSSVVTTSLILDSNTIRVWLTPESPLAFATKYYFFLGRGVKDVGGNQLTDTWYAADKTKHQFTTQAWFEVDMATSSYEGDATTTTSDMNGSQSDSTSTAPTDVTLDVAETLATSTVDSVTSTDQTSETASTTADVVTNISASTIQTLASDPTIPATAPAPTTLVSGGGGGGGGVSSDTSGSFQSPALPDVAIVAGAVDPSNNLVMFKLDATHKPLQMQLTMANTFDDAPWVPFSAKLLWNFGTEANGTTTVYAKFRTTSAASVPTSVAFFVNRPVSATSALTSAVVSSPPPPEPVITKVIIVPAGRVLGKKIVQTDELISRLRLGKRGAEVEELQSELKRLGFYPRDWRATGFYGPVTALAVKKYSASK